MNDPRILVQNFYAAMDTGDKGALADLISTSFTDRVTLRRPESLPGGGTVESREAVGAFLSRAAGRAPLTVDDLVPSESGKDLFASVTITMAGRSFEALERWTFDDGLVTEIRAFYWDTAAMIA